jgi:hypothetical protein
MKRRSVLLVLVILPNGSRSLIPAAWTDWTVPHPCEASSSADDAIAARALGKLGDLLAMRKIIDALQRRHIESVPQAESSDAAEPGLSRSSRSSGKLSSVAPDRPEPQGPCWTAPPLPFPRKPVAANDLGELGLTRACCGTILIFGGAPTSDD